jgi:hypothetical protein
METRYRDCFVKVHLTSAERRAFDLQAQRRGFADADHWLRTLGTCELAPDLSQRVADEHDADDRNAPPF